MTVAYDVLVADNREYLGTIELPAVAGMPLEEEIETAEAIAELTWPRIAGLFGVTVDRRKAVRR